MIAALTLSLALEGPAELRKKLEAVLPR